MPERLYTVAEVSEQLQAHPKTVQRWIREGRLQAYKPGGQKFGYRIPESAIERFVKGEPEGKTRAAA